MLSSTYCSMLTVTWTVVVTLRIMFYFSHLTTIQQLLSEKLLRMGVCVCLLSPGFLTICQIGPRLYGWGAHCLIWWLVTWLYHRGPYSLHSCSLCTCQISSITLNHAICRSSLMPLRWLGVLEMGRRWSTENWLITLWNGATGIICSYIWTRPRRWWSIFEGRELWLIP